MELKRLKIKKQRLTIQKSEQEEEEKVTEKVKEKVKKEENMSNGSEEEPQSINPSAIRPEDIKRQEEQELGSNH